VAHACNFIYQVAQGLQYAHQKGMVHRDIKPRNLILARQGNKPVVKVLDFGLAKATREAPVEGGLTQEGQMLGTPDYIAPEQARNARNADIRADIYSLGCTLYYLLSGGPPFRGSSLYEVLQAHHSTEAKPLNLVRPEVPWELAAVVGKMMAKAPARRYQTPAQAAEALKPFFKQAEAAPAERTPEISQMRPLDPGERAALPRSAPVPPQGTSTPGLFELAAKRSLESTRAESLGRERPEGAVREPSESDVKSLAPAQVRSRPDWLPAAIASGILLLGLLSVWAAGVLTAKPKDGAIVLENVPVKDGLIVLENVPVNAVVEVDGERVTATPSGDKPIRIEVRPGKHGVLVKRDDVVLLGRSVSVKSKQETKLGVAPELLTASPREQDRQTKPSTPSQAPVSNTMESSKKATEVVPKEPQKVASMRKEPEQVASTSPAPRADVARPKPPQASGRPRQPSFLGAELPLPSARHDPSTLVFDGDRPILLAPYCATPPVADGIVREGEYGNAWYVDFMFTASSRFGGLAPGMRDPRQSRAPDDLSVRLRTAYSDKSLFLATQVRDQFVDDQEEVQGHPQWNDGIEIFIDGDRVSNDFAVKGGGYVGSSEGFQLLADSAGHQATTSRDFTNNDWKAAAKRYNEGYVIEVEIPLSLIDVKDGPGKVAAGPGSLINLGLGITDNDVVDDYQRSYAFIRARPGFKPPIWGFEDSWTFGIKLAPAHPEQTSSDRARSKR
jgi:hypothetical protein